MDLHLSISDCFVKTIIYDKRDDFDSDIVNFPFVDGDVLRPTCFGVYISQLIHLLECPFMLVTLILVITFRQQHFSNKDSRTSMARTLMACLARLFRNRSGVPWNKIP